jgi:hypothetical protein
MPDARGPFRPEHVKDGDRYEISRGHPVYVSPAGARHGREHVVGALPLATDPAVREVGLDVGYKTDEDTVRAPDIAVGNVPDRPGWAVGAPALAVEYADRGTDEEDLQTKISELMRAGTRFVWVVRLVGPRRVEVYEQGRALRTAAGGEVLEAPGVLSRPVPVDALFDHDRASEVALANLLARHGFESLAAVRAEGHAVGHAEGRVEGLRVAIERICALLELPIDEERRARLSGADET